MGLLRIRQLQTSVARTGKFVAALLTLLMMFLAACTSAPAGVQPTNSPASTPGPAPATAPTILTPAEAASPAAGIPTAPAVGASAPESSRAGQAVISQSNATALKEASSLNESQAKNFSWLTAGQSLAVATENSIQIILVGSAAAASQISSPNPQYLTSSPDQRLLAWVSEENTIHLWDVPGGREQKALPGSKAALTGIALAPDGNILASATYDNAVQLWDTTSGQVMKTWQAPSWLSDLAFSPDGKLLAGIDLANFTVHIYNAASAQELRTLSWTESASPALYGAFFSPDWKKLAWVARGTVQLMDVESGKLGPTLSHEDFVNGISWSPDGSLLAAAAAATVEGNYSPAVILWDANSGEPLKTLVQKDVALRVAFSPDGKELATLENNGTLQLWAVSR